MDFNDVDSVTVSYEGDQEVSLYNVDKVSVSFDDREEPKTGVMTIEFSADKDGNIIRMGTRN